MGETTCEAPTIGRTVPRGTLRGVFSEVTHSLTLDHAIGEQIRLFCLDIDGGRFVLRRLKEKLYDTLGGYVLSRARIDRLVKDGHEWAITHQALRAIRAESGAPGDHVDSLGDMLLYVLLEDVMGAPKLLSRVEIAGATNRTRAEGVHILPASDEDPYHRTILGVSSMVGDIKYAIEEAFGRIGRIEEEGVERVLSLVEKTALDEPASRFSDSGDIRYLEQLLIPSEGEPLPRRVTSYAVFLGYTIGLDVRNYGLAKYPDLVREKVADDFGRHLPLIGELIEKNGLGCRPLDFFVVPFDDVEADEISVMKDVVEGNIEL